MELTMWDRDDYERTLGVLRDRLGDEVDEGTSTRCGASG
jgi:hypothetical protein